MASISYGEEKDASYKMFEKYLIHIDIALNNF